MTGLKPCPCGSTPGKVGAYCENAGGKWAFVIPDCCGEWHIEFRANYKEGDELQKLAENAWNTAPRASDNVKLTTNSGENSPKTDQKDP